MFSGKERWLRASAPILFCLFWGTAQADDPKANAAIARLLEVGWSISPQARAAADLQYQEVLKVAGSDRRALAASWLVLMQQRRFDEAGKRLEEHLAKEPEDLQALRAKTWVLAILKQYPAAMLAAERLSTLLASRAPPAAEDDVAHNELVGFLGRLLGYLGGPVADAVSQAERKALEKRLVDRLDAPRKALFEEARNGVLARFIEMTDESAEAQERAVAAARAERERTLTELAGDRAEAEARARDLEERRREVQDEFQDELSQIAKQDQPLVEELARLSARSSLLNNDLLFYGTEIARLHQLAATEQDPFRKQQYLLEADRLALIADRIDADVIAVNRLALGVSSQRAALAARQARTQSNVSSQIQRVERELAELAKRQRRNEGIEKRASRPAAGTTGKTLSLSAQATALSTYDSFPLEAAKAKLLDSLR